MREARYVSLIPRTTLHSDSEQYIHILVRRVNYVNYCYINSNILFCTCVCNINHCYALQDNVSCEFIGVNCQQFSAFPILMLSMLTVNG
jgi:hypothetical protein